MHEPQKSLPKISGEDPFELIEAFLDGELSELESRQMERCIEAHPGLAEEVEDARRIQDGLRRLPHRACPEAVSRRLATHVEQAEKSAARSARRRRWWIELLQQRPAQLAAGLAFVMAAVVSHQVLIDLPDAPAHPAVVQTPTVTPVVGDELSAQEVAQAEEEVKLALAYLGKLGRTAGKSVLKMTHDNGPSGESSP